MAGDKEEEAPADFFGEWMLERLSEAGQQDSYGAIIDNIVSNWITRLDPFDTVGTPEWQFDQKTLTVACAASKPFRDATAKVTAHQP